MREKTRGASTRDSTSHLRAIGVVVKALFWASVALAAVLALVSWVVPELTALRAFDLLDGAYCNGSPAKVTPLTSTISRLRQNAP